MSPFEIGDMMAIMPMVSTGLLTAVVQSSLVGAVVYCLAVTYFEYFEDALTYTHHPRQSLSSMPPRDLLQSFMRMKADRPTS